MLKSYLKIAWKVLLRRPFFTFVSLFGITFTLVVLMVATALLDYGLHPAEKGGRFDRSLQINRIRLHRGNRMIGSSPSYYTMNTYVRRLQLPEAIGLYSVGTNVAVYVADRRVDLSLRFTDAAFWYILDLPFVEGRPYDSTMVAGADYVAVITDRTAREVFGGQSAVGQFISTTSGDYRVIGVIAHGSVPTPEQGADIYVPLTISAQAMTGERLYGGCMALLLAEHKSDFAAIQDEWDGVMETFQEDYRAEWDEIICRADSQFDLVVQHVFDEDAETSVATFLGLCALLMILFMVFPTMNLVNLSVSRIVERSSEIGVRKAFGATSRTLVGQFVIENVILTLIGGGAAYLLSAAIIWSITTSAIIPYGTVDLDLSVLAYSVLICLFFGLFSGAYPAFKMSRLRPIEALRGVER